MLVLPLVAVNTGYLLSKLNYKLQIGVLGVMCLFAIGAVINKPYDLPKKEISVPYAKEPYPYLERKFTYKFLWWEKTVEFDSLWKRGVKITPDMKVLVCPHYYWTGNPLFGTLTLHDAHKCLLVTGLTDEQYRFIKSTIRFDSLHQWIANARYFGGKVYWYHPAGKPRQILDYIKIETAPFWDDVKEYSAEGVITK